MFFVVRLACPVPSCTWRSIDQNFIVADASFRVEYSTLDTLLLLHPAVCLQARLWRVAVYPHPWTPSPCPWPPPPAMGLWLTTAAPLARWRMWRVGPAAASTCPWRLRRPGTAAPPRSAAWCPGCGCVLPGPCLAPSHTHVHTHTQTHTSTYGLIWANAGTCRLTLAPLTFFFFLLWTALSGVGPPRQCVRVGPGHPRHRGVLRTDACGLQATPAVRACAAAWRRSCGCR